MKSKEKKKLRKIWSWVKKKNIYFNKVAVVGFVKNLLIMMMKKLEAQLIVDVNLQLTKKVPLIFHNLTAAIFSETFNFLRA